MAKPDSAYYTPVNTLLFLPYAAAFKWNKSSHGLVILAVGAPVAMIEEDMAVTVLCSKMVLLRSRLEHSW